MDKRELVLNPFIIMGVSTAFIIGCIVFSIPLYAGFLLGILFTSAVLAKSGYKLKELAGVVWSAVFEIKHLCAIILLIGATTSIWLSSGVVPAIMYFGFTYIEGINFLLAAFIIMAIVSIFMGTAVGTISTVGISLLGIGLGLEIPVEIMVGVLISGAFIADKISPLSGLVNLTMTTVGKSYKETIRGMLVTLVPTLIITAVIYYVIGRGYTSGNYEKLLYYKNTIFDSFNTSVILLSLPVIVLTLSVLGVNSILTVSIGLVIGIVLSMVFQHMTFLEVVNGIVLGYKGSTASDELNRMLASGGMVSMIEVIFVVSGGVILVKLLDKSGILLPIMDKLVSGAKSKVSLIFRTGLISSLMTILTCDQTVGIILPGRMLQEKYKEFKLENTVLARTISDTGTIIAPLMAWNVNSFIIKPIVGISASQYAVYSVLCYICPLVTMAVAAALYGRSNSKELSNK